MKTTTAQLAVLSALCIIAFGQPDTTQAASFDCSKASTKVEHIICDNPEISRLDEELAQRYKAALHDPSKTDSIKHAQKHWMKERNGCADANCVQSAYVKRNDQLRGGNSTPKQSSNVAVKENPKTDLVKSENEDGSNQGDFKGEYILVRAVDEDSVCLRFKSNLNRFRKLDFDQCNPRLSDRFPEFSRPYQWKEIPFDMALAEKAIRSTTDHSGYNPAEYPEDAEYHRKEGEERWQQWKKGSEPFRASGKVHMWLAKIDIDGDGHEDTILRMTPGGRYPIDPARPSLWPCDYNIGELYVIESANPQMAGLFNFSASWASDIIYYTKNNHFYLVSWEAGTSTTSSWFNQDLPDVGGTRGVVISSLHMDSPHSYAMPATMCLIDWVPTGHFIPASKPKHKHAPATR